MDSPSFEKLRALGRRAAPDPRVGPALYSCPDRPAKNSTALAKVDEHGVRFHRDGEAADLHRGVVDVQTRRHIPSPAVPRAGHGRPVEIALAKRGAAVRAGIVEGE